MPGMFLCSFYLGANVNESAVGDDVVDYAFVFLAHHDVLKGDRGSREVVVVLQAKSTHNETQRHGTRLDPVTEAIKPNTMSSKGIQETARLSTALLKKYTE